MPLDFNQRAEWQRDRRLRRRLLQVLHLARNDSPTGYLSGGVMVELINNGQPREWQIKDERHAITLLRDLVDKALATEQIVGLRSNEEEISIRNLRCRITAAGKSLLLETLPPDPDIEDGRGEP